MTTRNWQNITDYMDTVGTSLKTFTFPKTQNFVNVTIRGNANVSYTIGSQSGTLTPGQSISVSEKITSFTLTAASGTQTVEVWATEDGTQKVEDDSSDSISGLAASMTAKAYTLKSTDNLQSILDSGVSLIELNPTKTYTFNNINIPTGTKIFGNGATITSPNTNYPVFNIGASSTTYTADVLIKDVRFRASTYNADNLACIPTDCGIYLYKATKITIDNCRFEHFLGAGINCFNYPNNPPIDKMEQQIEITKCKFYYCYFGLVNWFNSEYGTCSLNKFIYCRCGIWSQSGNWNFNGNILIKCRAGFVSSMATNTLVTAVGSNPQHGNAVGNTINHCIVTYSSWATSNYNINGVDYQGVYIDGTSGAIPPNFTGNTMYYTDLKYVNSGVSTMPYWYITGCVLSQMTVSCDATAKMGLVGCSEQSSVVKTNVVSLTTPS